MLQSSLVRFGSALAVAGVATFAVFWVMQSLISSGGSVLNEQDFGRIESFVMQKPDDEIQTKERKPQKPPAPPQEPPKPDLPAPDLAQASTDGFDIGGFEIGSDLNVDAGLGGGSGDGEYLPIVKVAPTYPRRAAQKGIEGYVVVEFTVSKLGTVINPVVIEADPANIFNRAALTAAKKFKYKPKIENGKAIEVPGVRNIIRFELDKSSKKKR
ncbi:energy transducer TonB [Bacterioplanoides sp. SCSIO 12839]|uniref:energy transducer TonB n=1 Tax=Bacterioplanoides sp. SCSIO 12839 TaxID=2829569 RepID=UPI0021057542|nr:energy transducer TonB [Bacterioplanoides sp. SCSIO 12839]UTW47420.1 energy transducer TonB [Bacterioplanoides sp. SCSIO 12839]